MKKSCGTPEEPSNGRIIVTDAFLGSAVNYSCNEGYRLIGKDQRRCEISGKTVRWSGDVPICQNIPCLPPPDIPHGSYSDTFTSDFVYGSAVTYKCDKGYTLIGKDLIYCTTKDKKNGEWSGPAPECRKTGKQCSYPPAITNGKHSGQAHVFAIGTSVTYSCDPGYTDRKGTDSLYSIRSLDLPHPPL
ncbi:PREDICTED: complement component receptor 1-like protein [Gavialis gangeticus]|uniref:complement component receptor 1-like protein n=1 Tax=Gavialis gangeticus TaxID=94835 RepID=UPI00092E2AF1|nr:PREDICTED: complement component receptor 1-like protein [Gavialis gangeticus]